MKLLFIRHGEPDYAHDSLTEKGWREAEYLARRLIGMEIKTFYVSPLGRAKDTAAPTLQALNRTAIEKDWLREFHAPVHKPNIETPSIPWDWLPQDWTAEPRYFQYAHWMEPKVMAESTISAEYKRVTEGLDALIAGHGYTRQGAFYRVQQANNDTLALFCHFGVQCVLLSHLLNVSPMPLWHGSCAPPSSVTTLVTEERREGIAMFRMLGFGDISHLYANHEPPSFAARFRETYGNTWERMD